jgi:hypothetical protein
VTDPGREPRYVVTVSPRAGYPFGTRVRLNAPSAAEAERRVREAWAGFRVSRAKPDEPNP